MVRVHVCVCVCLIRSEANDLALSICEVVTGGTEVLVLDGAYHGHTRPLLGLSSYKIRQQVEPVIKPNCNSWLVCCIVASSKKRKELLCLIAVFSS